MKSWAEPEAKHPGEKEHLQAVKEVLLLSVEEVYNQHPSSRKRRLSKEWLNLTVSSLSVCVLG